MERGRDLVGFLRKLFLGWNPRIVEMLEENYVQAEAIWLHAKVSGEWQFRMERTKRLRARVSETSAVIRIWARTCVTAKKYVKRTAKRPPLISTTHMMATCHDQR